MLQEPPSTAPMSSPPAPAAPSPPVSSDAESWRGLHERLSRYVEYAVGPAGASDVAQEVLLRLVQKRGEITDEAHLHSWLFRVARNTMIDVLRRERRHPTVGEDAADRAWRDDDASLNDVVGAWLSTQIDELPEPYAEAVRLADAQGVPQREIAERLGLSASGARTRVQRGRKLLASHLRRSCDLQWDRRGNVLSCDPKAGCCC